jgi:hypothetical protein
MNHTPAPWSATGNHNARYASYSIKGPDDRGICAIASSISRPAAESAANAKLIAAAPDLMASLLDMVAKHGAEGGDSPELGKARAAIAKATE